MENTKKKYFLDLASPRDIDKAFMSDENVELIDLDTLEKIAEENKHEREVLVEKGRELLDIDVNETMQWLLTSRMDKTIESLQKKANLIADDTFKFLDNKLDLTDRDKKLINKMLHSSLKRLIREPIEEMKSLDDEKEQDAYKEFVERLFKLDE